MNYFTSIRTALKRPQRRGFTLLLAAIISSIVLSLGASIFTIAQKQVILSAIGRDSQFAFYAADTAVECALYYDVRKSAFATSSTPTNATISCDGVVIPPTSMTVDTVSVPGSVLTSFQINGSNDGLFAYDSDGVTPQPADVRCADVLVTKDSLGHTTIVGNGYNVPCSSLTSSSRALQRTVEVRY